MNSRTIRLMLSTKSIYALLFVCITHLGCSSSYRYRMEKKGSQTGTRGRGRGRSVQPGPSRVGGSSQPGPMGEGSGERNIQLKEKLDRFYNTRKFKYGSYVNDTDINSVIRQLGKSINMPSIDKNYNEFLNQYGCIYGESFEICGPSENITDSKEKTQYMSLKQRGFENRCIVNKMTEEQVKTCWLVAEIDQGDQYYINFGKNKEWLIYSMSLNGRSKPFARNFLEFLDKFFEAYEIKTEEKEEEDYGSFQ